MFRPKFPAGTPREIFEIRKAIAGFRSVGVVAVAGGLLSATGAVLDMLHVSFGSHPAGPYLAGAFLAATMLIMAVLGAVIWVTVHRLLRGFDRDIREMFADKPVDELATRRSAADEAS